MKEPRIEAAPAMLLAGIRRTHTMAQAAQTVPDQWQEFRQLGLQDADGMRAYGAMCSASGNEFEYMAAARVESFEGLPTNIGRMKVPAQTYAVFTHEEHVSRIGAAWQYIMQTWLPASGYEDAETPPFELYDERFDPDAGTGPFEIWFPIRAKK